MGYSVKVKRFIFWETFSGVVGEEIMPGGARALFFADGSWVQVPAFALVEFSKERKPFAEEWARKHQEAQEIARIKGQPV